MQITIRVKRRDEAERMVTIGPGDVIRAERHFDTSLNDWGSVDEHGVRQGGMKYEWIVYMTWCRMKRDGLLDTPGDNGGAPGPNNDFDLFMDGVEVCLPVTEEDEQGNA